MIQYEDYNPDAKLLINCLTTEYQWLPLLKERGKPYEVLLDYLYELGTKRNLGTENYDRKESQSNRIAEITGVKISKIKGWLIKMYDDILGLNYDEPELFNNGSLYHYILYFNYHSHFYEGFNIWLPTILSRFDKFEFYFIKAKLSTRSFWVKNISHTYENGKATTQVELKGGFSNVYRELLFEKAIYMKEVSFMEKHKLYDFQIDKILTEYAKKEKL
jgi:hypothetical protein